MSSVMDIMKMRREQFHIEQGKKSRDRLLQTKRKEFLHALQSRASHMEPKFRQIHLELSQDDTNRESVIATLLDDSELMNEIIQCCSLGCDRDTPLLILHNLCWTGSAISTKKLVNIYKVDMVLCNNLLEKNQLPARMEICLGAMSNLLALNSPEVAGPLQRYIEVQLVNHLIVMGNKLIDQQELGSLYCTILRTIVHLIHSIRFFEMEKQITSQQVFDLFKLSLYAFQVNEEQPIANMLRYLIMCSDFLYNLIEFLSPEWIGFFLKYFDTWISVNSKNKITLCLKTILCIFRTCKPIYICQFFQNSKFETLLFRSSQTNRELALQVTKTIDIQLQILLVLIQYEESEIAEVFKTRTKEMLTMFELSIRGSETYLASQLLKLLLEEYLDDVIKETYSAQDILYIIEDKFAMSMMHPKTKLNLLKCIYLIVQNVGQIHLTNNLKFLLDEEYKQPIDQDTALLIEEVFEVCGI